MKHHHDLESHPTKGILICIAGYFFVSLIGIFEKSLTTPIPLPIILFFQSFICLLLILPNVLKGGLKRIQSANLMTYVIRITTGLGCYMTLFYIIRYMPISQAFLYQYSASLWIPFIALFWLKKTMPKNIGYGIVVGFLGILLILKPNQGLLSFISVIGIMCGILQGISVVAIRKLSATESRQNILFYYFLAGAIITGLFAIPYWVPFNSQDFLKLLAIGVCTYFAQKLVTLSLAYVSASTLAPICYISLLFSGLIGWLLWHEMPDKISMLGMALVIAGCLLTLFTSNLNYRAQPIMRTNS